MKWYHKPVIVFVAILIVGPLALPLVWMSAAFKRWHKILITVLLILLTAWLINASVELYRLLLKEMQNLREVCR